MKESFTSSLEEEFTIARLDLSFSQQHFHWIPARTESTRPTSTEKENVLVECEVL